MRYLSLTALAATSLMLTGCADITCLPHCASRVHNSSSLVDFLYPDGRAAAAQSERPQLTIPLRVGLAFLPSANGLSAGLDPAQKGQLLERIKQRFASRPFVTEIVLVPDYYLIGQRGFAGLDGVQRLYGLDVMALVSFDQETHVEANDWSLAYLTIVGAYMVKGSRHDVSTLVDLALVDPKTRQLIIRAGGTDVRHGSSTLIDTNRKSREADIDGFNAATNQMIEHFETALTQFEANVRSGAAPITVVSRSGSDNPGKGGGGALGTGIIGVLLLAVARRCAASFR